MDPNEVMGEFCEAFAALDSWLSRGGSLPTDWRKATR